LSAALAWEAIMEVIHERAAGLDVHKDSVVACVRIMSEGKVKRECRTFETTTAGLEALRDWLAANQCTIVAMEATGVYWLPIWNILDEGPFELIERQRPAHQGRSRSQDGYERRDLDRGLGGVRSGQGELRPRRGLP
jgi:hypothetical protein